MTLRAFDRIAKSLQFLVRDLENESANDKVKSLAMVKMHAYILSQLMCYLEDCTAETEITGRKKKSTKKSDVRDEWENRRKKVFLTIHQLLQLPLQHLWQPPIVEESFVMLLAEICYKTLERDRDNRGKQHETVWQILGTLVKRYIHGITCTIKIIQLVKMYDTLAVPLATGVVNMVIENDCPTFISEICREIEQSNGEEAEARNIALFIETITTTRPELMLNVLDNILDYLQDESYIMRNCAIGVLGSLIIGCLTGENLDKEKRNKRDECLDCLQVSMLDVNGYVRSKVFQVLQKLGCDCALPVQRIPPLLTAVATHLTEKSVIMRKQSLQLMRVLLESNPFSADLTKKIYADQQDKLIQELREFQANVLAESGSGDDERVAYWQEIAPNVQKAIQKILDEDDDDDNDDEENEEIDVDVVFEKIRQQIVERHFSSAVRDLKRICSKLEYAPDMADLANDEKEQCYLLFALKIFLESEQTRNQDKEKFQSVAWKKRKEEIQNLKRKLNFTEQTVAFITEMEQAIPIIETLLAAAAPAVAIEACTFLGTAFLFNIDGAVAAIRKALSQVFSREESVRNNVAAVYKDIYLMKSQNNQTDRQTAIASVNGLMELFKGLQGSQSPALVQLITIWFANGSLTEEHLQVMWEKFSFKIPNTTHVDSRSALGLLTMVGHSQPKLITTNLNTLIKIGLQKRGREDLLLARDTARALMKIRHDSGDSMKEPIRHPNEHEIFEDLKSLLITKFEDSNDFEYVSFATDAINVIYQLANQPDLIIKEILQRIMEESIEPDVPESQLAKLLFVIGHVAIRYMVHLDIAVYKELKRRNAIRDEAKGKKKNLNKRNQSMSSAHSSARKARRSIYNKNRNMSMQQEDAFEEELSGACADDGDAEIIDETLEKTIVNGDGFLAQFVPLVLDVCQQPEKYKVLKIQAWGVLALTKMMAVSSEFCKDHLQLLITVLERSKHPEIRSNILIGISDLMIRFPNEVEPWTAHIYGRLRDNEVLVRKTAMKILSNLVKREMIRVKGQMSEMALCIVDSNEELRNDAKQFFQEVSQKGNVLYNILPDILSRLTDNKADIDEDDLRTILKYVLGLLQKEREIDALLDKICTRLKLATAERQSRDLGYCLSLLNLGKKGIIRLTTNLPMLKDKIHNKEVYRALRNIIETARKKADTKEVAALLEEAIDKLIDADDENNEGEKDKDREAMPPPMELPKKNHMRRRKVRNSSSEDEDEDQDDEENDRSKLPQTPKNTMTPRRKIQQSSKRKAAVAKRKNTAENSDEEEEKTPNKTKTNLRRSARNSRSADGDNLSLTPTPSPRTSSRNNSRK